MRIFKFVLIMAAMQVLTSPATVHAAGDPNQPDTLRVDSVTSFVSGIGIVPVIFFNDEELTQ
ncbi:MAG: hypothetical protein NTW07_05835, partial [candidate division Zixibacteria bacterium]|nr:hypothetical protein [candidate division Zixibacteria bacterium]